jgi:hypothetical protein
VAFFLGNEPGHDLLCAAQQDFRIQVKGVREIPAQSSLLGYSAVAPEWLFLPDCVEKVAEHFAMASLS